MASFFTLRTCAAFLVSMNSTFSAISKSVYKHNHFFLSNKSLLRIPKLIRLKYALDISGKKEHFTPKFIKF